MTAAPRLEMRGVRKRFGATIALDGVDLDVAAGECLALVGQNGAGKSTLMKVLSGAHAPDAGEMRLDGEPYRPRDPLEARRRGVAMIYQELSLAPHLSVEENLVLGLEPSRLGWLDRKAIRRTALEALEQLQHPEIRPEARAGSLTIAQQQLVEIARALAVGCRVLVLDEPTSSITQRDAARLFELLDRLRSRGQAIVYISHFIEECKRVAQRFIVLRDGRSVGGGDLAATTPAQIVDLMVGQKIERLYPRSPRTPGQDLLSAGGLTLRRGEVLGLAGLVGAGRTEFLREIFGLEPLRAGAVTVGTYAGPASPALRWSQGLGFVSEDRKQEGLALGMSLADNLTLSKLERFILPSRQAAAARRWIGPLAIRCEGPGQRISELSGGNQQKVAIARLLHHDVDVLLLDEPTRGIDVGSKAQIYQLIDDLVSKEQKAVLLVSSYIPELLGTCDRIAVMCRGRLGPARPVADLDEHRLMLEATGESAA
ncbi:MAG TPA: sugar ABC transporter ATP-binding protein [Planctomycetota bacterium]|jgi:ribose transport system ATP-binding protein|nr:sugar ABC transporter ATP-binding protein [Planctomycetota bacterium]